MYEEKTERLIQPILDRNQFELVDVEYVKEGGTWYLRAYIDKEGGITVNDCELVAREMNELLDKEDYVEDSYVFECQSCFIDDCTASCNYAGCSRYRKYAAGRKR